jgi:hypothetical protein
MDYPKFDFTEKEKENFSEVILSKSNFVDPSKDIEAVEEDPSDSDILPYLIEN